MRDQLGGLRSSGEKGKDKAISVVAWEIHDIKDPNSNTDPILKGR